MKKIFLGLCGSMLTVLVISCAGPAKVATQVQPVLTTVSSDTVLNPADSFAYGLGMNIANNLKEQGVKEISYEALKRGMKDVFTGTKPAITEQDANNCIQKTLQDLSAEKIAAEKARAAAFLDTNAKRPGPKR